MIRQMTVHVDMHLWQVTMLELEGTAGITDENVNQSQPMVRAMLVQRMEMIWRCCEPHIDVPVDGEGSPLYKADPRFVEAGIRVCDRLARWFKLEQPQVSGNEPDKASLMDQRELARQQVLELSARMAPPTP